MSFFQLKILCKSRGFSIFRDVKISVAGQEDVEAVRHIYWDVIEHGGSYGDSRGPAWICFLRCIDIVEREYLYSPVINVRKASNITERRAELGSSLDLDLEVKMLRGEKVLSKHRY
jgi:hypothetical protein